MATSIRANYWSLGEYGPEYNNKQYLIEELQKRGIRASSSKAKSELIDLISSHDRGLLRYNTCSVQELRKFVLLRGLEQPKPAGKSALVKTLELADEARIFDRFLELPVDLRQNIYDYYFGWFEDELLPDMPMQPPISRACKTLRQETLKMFYSRCIFAVYICFDYYTAVLALNTSVQNAATAQLFSNTPQHLLALIRKWRLCVEYQNDEDDDDEYASLEIDIVLSADAADYDIAFSEHSDDQQDIWPAVKFELEKFLNGVMQRPPSEKWASIDLAFFRDIVQTGLEESQASA